MKILPLKLLKLISQFLMLPAYVAIITPLLFAHSSVAEITPTRDALAVAKALTDTPSIVTAASFVEIPTSGNPVAISTTPLGEFPTSGTSFVIMSTGNTTLASMPNSSISTSTDNNGPIVRGARDVTILKIDLNIPTNISCLSIRYRFLSEEFPEFVGSNFNDAFIAELDQNTWDAGSESDPTITAPNNFAFDTRNKPISVNSSGELSVSPESAIGTTYDAATRRLRASTPVTPGAHSLYLSIFDQGDRIYDSSVFVDRLTLSNLTSCTPGASVDLTPADPAGITALKGGLSSIPSTSVFLPSKLTISKVKYSRGSARSGKQFSLKVIVTDTRGFRVSGTRVRLLKIPNGSFVTKKNATKTGLDGTAKFKLTRVRSPAYLYIRADRKGSGKGCDGICDARLLQIK